MGPAILADPTLMLTKRGAEWLMRAVAAGVDVATSATLLEGIATSDESVIRPYFSFFWRPYSRPPLVHGLLPVRALEPRDEMVQALTAMGSAGLVAAELWTGLLHGMTLVARRPPVLDLFVAGGATLIIAAEQTSEVSLADLRLADAGLAASLTRRVRFMAVRSRRDQDAYEVPPVAVLDRGKRSFR